MTQVLPYDPTFYHIFYDIWYGTPAHDGQWYHWNNSGHNPTIDDIDSDYYPLLGPYSSRDPAVLNNHMQWIKEAGIGVVVLDWWGNVSGVGATNLYIDGTVPYVLDAVAAAGLKACFMIDAYNINGVAASAAQIVQDIANLYAKYGNHQAFFRMSKNTKWANHVNQGLFYIFAATKNSNASWATALDGIRNTSNDAIVVANVSPLTASTVDAEHMDGMFNYDIYNYDGSTFASLASTLHGNNELWIPSIGPGFYDIRDGELKTKDRQNGALYDTFWGLANGSSPDFISITSFNEWHEGTMLEPAVPHIGGGNVYKNFDYAYNKVGMQAAFSYLERTKLYTPAPKLFASKKKERF